KRKRRRTAAAVACGIFIVLVTIFAKAALTANPPTIVTVGVGTQGDVGQYASHAIVNGNPAVAYFNYSEKRLQFIRATNASGTAWAAPVTVDVSGYVGQYCSLVIVNGNPAIAYSDATTGGFQNDSVKYVRANDASGTTWGTPVTIDGPGNGQYTILLVVNGRP